MLNGPLIVLIVGLIVLGWAAYSLLRHLNPDHRLVRKRRKNYGKVITRAKRPMVMLNVKTDK